MGAARKSYGAGTACDSGARATEGARMTRSPLMPTNHARPMIVDEPRIRTVRYPESVARPRGSAKQDKDDRCDPAEKIAFEMIPARQSPNDPGWENVSRP